MTASGHQANWYDMLSHGCNRSLAKVSQKELQAGGPAAGQRLYHSTSLDKGGHGYSPKCKRLDLLSLHQQQRECIILDLPSVTYTSSSMRGSLPEPLQTSAAGAAHREPLTGISGPVVCDIETCTSDATSGHGLTHGLRSRWKKERQRRQRRQRSERRR